MRRKSSSSDDSDIEPEPVARIEELPITLDAPPVKESDTVTSELAVTSGTAQSISPRAAPADDWIHYAGVLKMPVFVWRPERRYGIRVNPRVTIATTLIVWVFLVVCICWPAESYIVLDSMKKGITEYFSWLYIGTQDAWMLFIFVLFVSKYGKIKLGDDDEEPEYDSPTWFMMLFSCGVSTGLFYFGVNEPLTHYDAKPGSGGANRYSHLTSDERAQWSMNLVFYHWGLHGWVGYTLIALLMGFVGYKKKLPVTMRSCFYPLLGDKVFGVLGDIIDTLSASCTLFGVCVSLGLGVSDIIAGINRLTGCTKYLTQSGCIAAGNEHRCFWGDNGFGRCRAYCDRHRGDEALCRADPHCQDNCSTIEAMGVQLTNQNLLILIWVISSIAAVSVVLGVKRGIRAVSVICFSLGMFLWTYVFLSDKTQFFLDMFTQQFGLYVNTLLQVGFHTDAYARHLYFPSGAQNALDAQNAPDVQNVSDTSREGAHTEWFHNWTMFYWGWWVAWSPFVGMFVAKISRGRSIRQVIVGTMTAPAMYCFLWFTCFGGAGLRMERMAASIDLQGHESPVYLEVVDGRVSRTPCDPEDGSHCVLISRLSKRSRSDQWMDMISSFHGVETFMVGLSLFAIILYFVTSSDSGSLIVDALCSNGHEEPPVPQKLFWALMVGATATALVVVGTSGSGENKTLQTLQSASVCCGLPYTIMLCFMCVSLWKACAYDCGDLRWKREHFFKDDLTDIIDFRWTKQWRRKVGRVCLACIAPWYYLRRALRHLTKEPRSRVAVLLLVTVLFYLIPFFVILYVAGVLRAGLAIAGWWYLCFGAVLTQFRGEIRRMQDLDGDMVNDMLAVFLTYGLVCEQIDAQFEEIAPDKYKQ